MTEFSVSGYFETTDDTLQRIAEENWVGKRVGYSGMAIPPGSGTGTVTAVEIVGARIVADVQFDDGTTGSLEFAP